MNLASLLNPAEESRDNAQHTRNNERTAKAPQTPSPSPPLPEPAGERQWSDQQAADVLASSSAAPKRRDSTYESPVLPYTSTSVDGPKKDLTSPPDMAAIVKTEDTNGTPNPAPLPSTETAEPAIDPLSGFDEETAKAIRLAQNEYGTRRARRSSAKGASETAMSPAAMGTPQPAFVPPAKKRPAPKNSSKGGVKTSTPKKPTAKKRKVGTPDVVTTPKMLERSATPASTASGHPSRPPGSAKKRPYNSSRTATPRATSSSTAASRRSSIASRSHMSDAASSVKDENDVYCICRKPDNHTWMIGCDGGCEDWFHGKCVNMKESDADLVDKYICPNCYERGVGVTTWKPMCRRQGCRRPARLKKGGESKYCTNDCGVRFMRQQLDGCGALDFAHSSKHRDGKNKRRKATTIETDTDVANTDASEDHQPPDLGPLGGPLRAHELKTLIHTASSAPSFRRLGSTASSTGVLTPPASASPKGIKQDSHVTIAEPDYTPHERTRLDQISERKTHLRGRHKLLQDRTTFVTWAKERAIAAKSAKIDGCQYDSRLAWDEATFRDWRESSEGKLAFERASLESDNVVSAAADGEGESWVCGRKKCGRHSGWQKIAVQDVRFEEGDVGDEMRDVDREEGEIVKGAVERGKLAIGGEGGDGGEVEVVKVTDEDKVMIDV